MTVESTSPFGVLLARRQQALASAGVAKPEPHQRPPSGMWDGWLLLGGRGSGKTWAAARAMIDHVKGPPCVPGPHPHWMAIIGPTLGDAVQACFEGPSGLGSQDSSAQAVSTRGGTFVRWPNGSQAKIYGADKPDAPDRLRAGGNTCLAWLEEMAAWRYLEQMFEQLEFGLRVGPHPHWIASTTPKPRPLVKRLHKGEVPRVVVTHATMWQNPHLSPRVREKLEEAYGGRRIGRQELFGELIDEDENALWSRATLDAFRFTADDVPDLDRITVGIDPSGGQGEQGIVVAGKAKLVTPRLVSTQEEVAYAMAGLAGQGNGRPPKTQWHGFTLDDRTCCLSPDGWARRAVRAAIDWQADDICAETNYGGDMVLSTVRAACEAEGVNIPVRKVVASRGKKVRAEPVAALAEQGRWHMVGVHPELETQLCTWTEEWPESPDRLDAMVWTGWHMRVVSTATGGEGSFGGSAFARSSIASSP